MKTIGFAFCGSFCTFRKTMDSLKLLSERYEIIPIFSPASYHTDSRFGSAEDWRKEAADICGKEPLSTIAEVEPIGPKKLLDLLVIAPCTGNTLGKLANGVADTSVTLACKAHLRNGRPVVLGISTNDGLAASGENIGKLLNRKHYYFVPFGQDSPRGKPCSLVARMELLPQTVAEALEGRQLQPILTCNSPAGSV